MDNIRKELAKLLTDAWEYAEEVCAEKGCRNCLRAEDPADECLTSLAVDYMIAHGVTVQETGYWVKEPPYWSNGMEYKKAQTCSVCHARLVSDGHTPYPDPPHCSQCGAKLLPTPPKGE